MSGSTIIIPVTRTAFRAWVQASPPILWLATALLGLCIATLPLPLALVVGAAIPGILLVLHPALGLCLLALSIPFGLLYQIPLLGSQLGAPEILLAATLFLWLLDSLTFRRRAIRPDMLSLALYLGVVALSLLASTSLLDGLAEVVKWSEVWLLYLVARTLLTPRWRVALVVALLVAGSLQGVLGLYQFLFRAGPEAFRIGSFLRAYGTFAQPNPYAGYLGLVAPLASEPDTVGRGRVVAGAQQPAWHHHAGAGGRDGDSGGRHRGELVAWALVGLAASSVVVVVMRSRRAFVAAVAVLALLLFSLGTGLGSGVTGPFISRFTDSLAIVGTDLRTVEITDENFAVIERAAHWAAGIEMFGAHPWLGVGAGNYPVAYPAVALPRWQDPLGHTHNIYINVAAESGVIGLLAYSLVLWGMFATAWQAHRRSSGYAKAIALGVVGILVHLSVHSLFDSLFVQRLYLHLALALATLEVHPKQESTRL